MAHIQLPEGVPDRRPLDGLPRFGEARVDSRGARCCAAFIVDRAEHEK